MFMLDTTTGDITLDAIVVGRRFTLASFHACALAAKSSPPLVGGGSWQSFDIGKRDIDGAVFDVTLRFEGERLAMISMALSDGEESPDDAWSEKSARAAKARHDAWLAKKLGPPPYAHGWGSIESTYDPRSVSSGITISYAKL